MIASDLYCAGRHALTRAAAGAIDLLLPPRALNEGAGAVQSLGMGAPAWSRIAFIDSP